MTDNSQRGSSIVEALVALFLLLVSLVSVAPLFVFAMHNGVADADMGRAGATAVERMEQLNQVPFGILRVGGRLDTNVPGYYRSDSEVLTRWRISLTNPPNANLRKVEVIAIAQNPTAAPRKSVRVVTVRVRG
jgi:Tfp pilus assembly protein PilW